MDLDRAPCCVAGCPRTCARAGASSSLDMAEIYVPRTAELLGTGWTCDELDFGQVSIASARLQSMLRQLEEGWAAPSAGRDAHCPAMVVGVPDGEQHTLGATVLAGQLRHRGMSVHLDITLDHASLASALQSQRFVGIFLSVSGARHLESCRHMVEMCRKQGQGTPVIIGGTILEHQNDITDLTGCDLATSDMVDALVFCGLGGMIGQSPAVAPIQTASAAG